jgi:hypothetical protein
MGKNKNFANKPMNKINTESEIKNKNLDLLRKNVVGVTKVANFLTYGIKNSVSYSNNVQVGSVKVNQKDKGQQYLADCGFKASWLFKCPPFENLVVCVNNQNGGAWVPYVIMYRAEYIQCQYVKESGQGKQFSQDYDVNYK